MRGAMLALLMLVAMSVVAQPEIHRCVLADGTIAFQEMPCPEPTPADSSGNGDTDGEGQRDSEGAVPADGFFDFVNPFDEPEDSSAHPDPEPEVPASPDRTTCEKTTRDAIDAIDLEMRKGYSKEQGQRYLAELLALTQQLRACKSQ